MGTVIVTVIANILLGFLVLLRGTKRSYSLPFFAFTIWVSLWAITNLLTNYNSIQYRYNSGQGAFIAAFMAICTFTWFVLAFTGVLTKFIKFFILAVAAAATIATLDGLIIKGVKVVEAGTETIAGTLYNTYLFAIVVLVAVSIVVLSLRKKKLETKSQKAQISLIQIGVGVATLLGLVFNAVLPVVLNNWQYANFGPFATVILVATISYAIIKHGLFDIRYVVFRLLAYTISLSIIVILFVLLAFNITTILFGGQSIPFSLQIYYVITAVIVALLFGPIKKLVDRISNRLFFQQNYSVHDAAEKISSFSTRSVDPYSIQQHSLRVFEDTIRPEYAGFIMFDSNGNLKLSTNIGKYPTKSLELSGFLSELSKIHHKNILASEVMNSKSHMKEYFELSHIGLITRLATNNKSIGYVVLGDKKNGNAYSSHDLQFLTLTANDLALALQNAQRYEEIRAFNETLQEKVNKATAALKRTNAKLIALDDIKDEFISMTSHQLRTPLTSIKGYLSMILEGDLGKISPTQHKALKEAFNSSQRMVFLISDFLNVSRIRTGKFTIERKDTDLGKIVTEEIAQLREIAAPREQTINYKAPKNFPTVSLDEAKIRQVMMNLIDNAIFYTPKNGHIDVSLSCTDKEIIFKVTDTGIGVATGDQHRLFTKFFRAENARNARPDGTGLGLFMAQKIIDIQGGKIIFKSVENEGSTFGFRFPLKLIKSN